MYLYNGKLYFTKDHVTLLKKEPEYVKQRYHAIANATFSKNNTSQAKWLVDNDTNNETIPRTITSGNQLALDTIFNGHVRASDLTHGAGTYRVYAAIRDPEGNILKTYDGTELKAWWQFSKT